MAGTRHCTTCVVCESSTTLFARQNKDIKKKNLTLVRTIIQSEIQLKKKHFYFMLLVPRASNGGQERKLSTALYLSALAIFKMMILHNVLYK